jgi:hypothetical protein
MSIHWRERGSSIPLAAVAATAPAVAPLTPRAFIVPQGRLVMLRICTPPSSALLCEQSKIILESRVAEEAYRRQEPKIPNKIGTSQKDGDVSCWHFRRRHDALR